MVANVDIVIAYGKILSRAVTQSDVVIANITVGKCSRKRPRTGSCVPVAEPIVPKCTRTDGSVEGTSGVFSEGAETESSVVRAGCLVPEGIISLGSVAFYIPAVWCRRR